MPKLKTSYGQCVAKKKGESEANWNVNSKKPPKKSTMKNKS